jgi:predicted esterase
MPHIRVTRTARYETLGRDDGNAHEIWFVLHGYGQLAASFIRLFALLDDGTRLIIAPEALNRFYLDGVESAPPAERRVGATWMTREDREHEITDYVEYLDTLSAQLPDRVRQGGRSPRIVVFGFSQATATVARWVARGKIRPDYLVLWGGFLPADVPLTDERLRAPELRIIIGSSDRFISQDRTTQEDARLVEASLPYRMTRYDGGHGINREVLLEVARDVASGVQRS